MVAPHRRAGRALGLLAAVALTLLIPATAFADTGGPGAVIAPAASNGATAWIEGVTFNNKLLATIRVGLVCDELTYFDWETYEEVTTTEGFAYADGQLLQAQGRSIASAFGSAYRMPVTCDGSTVNDVAIQVYAQTLPLKRGDALVGASVWATGGGEGGDHYAATGPTSVRLR